MTRDEMIFREAQRLAGDGGMSVRDVENARETVDLFWEAVQSAPTTTSDFDRMRDDFNAASERVAKKLGHATRPREPSDVVVMMVPIAVVQEFVDAVDDRECGDGYCAKCVRVFRAAKAMKSAMGDHFASRAKGGGG